MTTLQHYLLANAFASVYGEGVYNCTDYNNATNCTTTTGTNAGGSTLASTGMDVFLIGGIALVVLVAGILLLVKRMRHQPAKAE